MEIATYDDETGILDLYRDVIEKVNTTTVRLGWNIEEYPDKSFVHTAISRNEMVILRENERIIAAAVVNHTVIPGYDEIQWEVNAPKEKLATIHALAVVPDKQGDRVSYAFLADIEEFCRSNGDKAIHLDVIDTNIPAYKLYLRNGFKEIACTQMYYEVVGSRDFWMMEKIL